MSTEEDQDWTFTDFGPRFDEHVAAHLPGYFDVQRMVALVAEHVVPYQGVIADLGCSTGQTCRSIASVLPRNRHPVYWLYDGDASMLGEVAIKNDIFGMADDVRLVKAMLPYDPLMHARADLTLMLWLLQFCPPADWVRLLRDARLASNDSGVLLIAAKTRHDDVRWQQVAVSALDDYKEAQGVSVAERAAKTRALRGTLHEASVAEYGAAMRKAGWCSPTVLWRWHVWSILGSWASDA